MIDISCVLELESLAPVNFHAACVAVWNLAQLLVDNVVDHSGDDQALALEVLVRERALLILLVGTDILDSAAECFAERE